MTATVLSCRGQCEALSDIEQTNLEVECVVPKCTVKNRSIECVESRDVGPFPFVQGASARDEYIANIFHDLVGIESMKLDMPLGTCFVPSSFGGSVLELHVLADAVLVCYTLPISQNFGTVGVKLGPFCGTFVGQLIRMGGTL
jgi:hypothetical protein